MNLNAKIMIEESPLHLGNPVRITFSVVNQISSTVSVVNPDVGKPSEEMGWPFSIETYQIMVLLSFHIIIISLRGPSGESSPMIGPHPWATPTLMPRLQLAPGDSFDLHINLSDLFQLQQVGKYHLTVEYGDQSASARVETDLLIE